MRRILTSIDKIDSVLGGFEEKKAYLLKGDTGTGKTTFAIQYLHKRAGLNSPGILITIEDPEDLILYANSIGLDLKDAVKKGRVIILRYPINLEEFTSPSLNFSLEDILSELASYNPRKSHVRLVIDPVGPLFIFGNITNPQSYCRRLLSRLSELGFTSLLINDSEPDPEFNRFHRALERTVHGIVELSAKIGDDHQIRRSMRLLKIKGTPHEQTSYPFDIKYGEGLYFLPVEKHAPLEAVPVEEPVGEKDVLKAKEPLKEPSEEEESVPPLFHKKLKDEVNRAKRYRHSLSVIILNFHNWLKYCDIPHREDFLRKILLEFKKWSRECDIVARYSGDKFIVILPETSKDGANKYAEKIRMALEKAELKKEFIKEETTPRLEYGMSIYPEDSQEPDELIHKAFKDLHSVIEI